jgi:hypothetical protein
MTNISNPYPLINLTGNNAFVGLAEYVNTITGGIWWSVIMLIIFAVLTLGFIRRDNPLEKSALASMFIVALLSTLLSIIGLVSVDLVFTLWIMLGPLALWVWFQR